MTTIYTIKENKDSVINTLEVSSLPLFTWFNNNFMKANKGKSHTLLVNHLQHLLMALPMNQIRKTSMTNN